MITTERLNELIGKFEESVKFMESHDLGCDRDKEFVQIFKLALRGLASEKLVNALQFCASDDRECRNSYECCGKCSGIYEAEDALDAFRKEVGDE